MIFWTLFISNAAQSHQMTDCYELNTNKYMKESCAVSGIIYFLTVWEPCVGDVNDWEIS